MFRDLTFRAQWCEAIIKSSEDAIISKTLDGVVSSWNIKAQNLFGYSEEEIVGRPITLLFPERLKNEETQILQKIYRGESISHFDTIRLHKNGTPIDVSVTISPIRNEEGGVIGISTIIRDIAERKRAEREISRLSSERLALLNARTAELHMTEERLEQRTQELRATLRRLASAERKKSEEERKRLSQELHDEIGQMLTALNFNLEIARRKIQSPDSASALEVAIQISEEIVKSVRHIMYQLRPPQLDEFGLISALRWHIDHLKHSSPLHIILHDKLGKKRLSPDLEMTCFRIVQESITNILRHASATQADIHVMLNASLLDLHIRDDGVGFEAPPDSENSFPAGHFGLRGMRERVIAMNGRFSIVSAPGRGCVIEISIPKDVEQGDHLW